MVPKYVCKLNVCVFTCLKDLEMFDEATDTPTVARTSNLNEELGQVSHCQCCVALVHLLMQNWVMLIGAIVKLFYLF